ncbi:hypothetical protein THAOC_09724 [Thalassiosira oceanica]|uniref:Uncharacterized protein n=1 Tax=Thalassiosira oceanica TaxID=159749 RepID=K0TEU2_THAOC|nr:hypothetical protein THAOC_09724 [Thalassiosira oceanica]|eukprot:EJK69057.1 hypothetical protein THAOC_09724 [Thalassiosira oceanica]
MANVGRPDDEPTGTAAPPVQEVPEGGTSAPTIRALTDDEPPIPVWHVFDDSLAKSLEIVDRKKESESGGVQLHDGPTGPPCFPHEFDDSLEKERARAAVSGIPDPAPEAIHDDEAPRHPSAYASEFDDSLEKAAAAA